MRVRQDGAVRGWSGTEGRGARPQCCSARRSVGQPFIPAHVGTTALGCGAYQPRIVMTLSREPQIIRGRNQSATCCSSRQGRRMITGGPPRGRSRWNLASRACVFGTFCNHAITLSHLGQWARLVVHPCSSSNHNKRPTDKKSRAMQRESALVPICIHSTMICPCLVRTQ
jgi:hypothetical protein